MMTTPTGRIGNKKGTGEVGAFYASKRYESLLTLLLTNNVS